MPYRRRHPHFLSRTGGLSYLGDSLTRVVDTIDGHQIGGSHMTLNRRLSTGDLARLRAELKAQLPPGYSPYDDFWAAPFDCDCCAEVLDHPITAEWFLSPRDRYAGHPCIRRRRRAG